MTEWSRVERADVLLECISIYVSSWEFPAEGNGGDGGLHRMDGAGGADRVGRYEGAPRYGACHCPIDVQVCKNLPLPLSLHVRSSAVATMLT